VAGVRSSEFLGGDLQLVLDNDLAAIAGGQQALALFCERHALSQGACNRLEVIFEELVSNIVRHGFTEGTGQSVRVFVRATPSAIELTIEDDGVPFDPLAQAKPDAFSTLENARLGGLGIPLVLKLAKSVRYEAAAEATTAAGFHPVNRLIVTAAKAD
jgi:anti-sigma regulatory factor (Ser/Thr protein kinase)